MLSQLTTAMAALNRPIPQLTVFLLTTVSLAQALYRSPPSEADYTNSEVVLTLVTNKLERDEAAQACADILNGNLVRIDSDEINDAIRAFSDNSWSSAGWGDQWFGLQWRTKTSSSSTRSLVWSDNCQDLDRDRYTDFKAGDDVKKDTEYCYRIKGGFEWERRTCSEANSFICEQRIFPYSGSLTLDTSSGMMVVSKGSAADCTAVCNQLYGCYRVSDMGNSSCVVDLISDNSEDSVKSLYKPLVITASDMTLDNSQLVAIQQAVQNLVKPPIDTPCDSTGNSAASNGLIAPSEAQVPIVLTTAQPCTSTFVLQSSSCHLYQPSASTVVETATVYNTVTATPAVSIVPTTVEYTHTVTMTTNMATTCTAALTTALTSPCPSMQASTNTQYETRTVYDTVTATNAVSLVPTTVVLTDTVTQTVDMNTCAPSVLVEYTTLTMTQTLSAPTSLCSSIAPVHNLTSDKVDEAVSSIVSELIINERSTSRARARYTSAPDNRVSSRTMGCISMGFIFVVMLCIMAIDAPTMYLALKEKVDNLS